MHVAAFVPSGSGGEGRSQAPSRQGPSPSIHACCHLKTFFILRRTVTAPAACPVRGRALIRPGALQSFWFCCTSLVLNLELA